MPLNRATPHRAGSRAGTWRRSGVKNKGRVTYSSHFDFGSGIHPVAVHCLLTSKNSNTYNRVLGELQRQIPRAHPRTVLVDFEKAAVSAFSGTCPDATVTGCYFHLCQSVIRKVNEIKLKTEYETNDEVRTYTVHPTHLHPWPQTTRTCGNLQSSCIPRQNLESARCRVRRHSSHAAPTALRGGTTGCSHCSSVTIQPCGPS